MSDRPVMVVGTSAPRRHQLMKEAFEREFELQFVSPDINEKAYRSNDAAVLTRMIASAKMDAVLTHVAQGDSELKALLATRPGSVAVTFDQVVVWDGQIREKPADAAEAKRFILGYSNSSLATVQTTCVYAFDVNERALCPNETMTYYGELPEELIDRVVARGDCLHTAGAFVVEDVDMHSRMIKVDPGTETEVQGVCANAIREGMRQLFSNMQL